MAASFCLKPSRDQRPKCAKKGAKYNCCRKGNPPGRNRIERQTNDGNAKATHIGLPFTADIEQAAVESHRYRQTCKNKIGGIKQRVGNTFAIAERSTDHQFGGFQRIFSDKHHHQPGNRESNRQVNQRDKPVIRPAWKFVFHCCASINNSVELITLAKAPSNMARVKA